MEQWENGCLTILLSDQELTGMGVSFQSLDYRKPATKEAIRALLTAAKQEIGLPTAERIQVEALPVEEGCMLFITPLPRRRTIRLHRSPHPRVYEIADTDALLRLAKGLRQGHEPIPLVASSLYRFGAGYRLVLYPQRLPERWEYLLREFTRPLGSGPLLVAYTAEHGHPIVLGHALDQLMDR